MITSIFKILIVILQSVSVIVILYGVFLTAIRFIRVEFSGEDKISTVQKLTIVKNSLVSYILLGLEILVCSGIILSILRPTLYDILLLGSTVALRTLISFFLKKELKSSKREK